jgi:sugar-specific transcriptional regulator TrmB
MVGLKISSEEVSKIIDILGLSDSEQGLVYLNLLSLGMATLGQLSIVTGLDYIQTQEALNVLIGDNLVKRIPGKIGRYFALQPFLRALSLSYDPITLFNIRKDFKESYNEMDTALIQQNKEASNLFSSHAASLVNDFSTKFNPITQEYSSVMDKHQTMISTSGETIQSILKAVKSQIKDNIEGISLLFDKISDTNEAEINNIPIMFQNYLPDIHKQLQLVQNQISNNLVELSTKTSFNIDQSSESLNSELITQTESISSYLSGVQVFTEKKLSEIRDFTQETKNHFEILTGEASTAKPKFKQISDRFNSIESDIDLVRSSMQGHLETIEGLISETISDINARKMFRGKEEFIQKLKLITEENESISTLLNSLKNNSVQLKKVSNDLAEIESNIVNATEKGLKLAFGKFEDQKNQYTKLLTQFNDNFNQKIGIELNNNINDKRKDIIDRLMLVKSESDQLLRNLTQNLESELNSTMDYFSQLLTRSISDFKRNLIAVFEKKREESLNSTKLENFLLKIDDMALKVRTNMKGISKEVITLETTSASFFKEISSFISKYSEKQLNTFTNYLSESLKTMNEYLEGFDSQTENEISALMFSIKEMRQKLELVSAAVKSIDISQLDPSLLDSDLVIGEPAIIMLLRDLTLRTKSSLTILMPRPELQTLISASKLPFKTRVSIIGDFRKVPETTINKVLASSNVRLKQLDGIEFWGCIRDAEELLICPEPMSPGKEDLIGVITTNGNLVDLFSQEIITYTTKSREILPTE